MKTIIRNVASGMACLSLVVFTNACKTEDVTSPDKVKVRPLTSREARIVSSSNDFAFKAFARVSESEGNKNVFISPLSISSALAMTYNGANSTTKDAIQQTLDLSGSAEEVNQSFKSVAELLSSIDNQVKFTTANSIWHRNAIQLQSNFRDTNKEYFDAEIRGLDFDSPNAKNTINNWVKTKTQGKIEDIVDDIRSDHILFLINAIYFKGSWTYKFDENKTQNAPFQLESGGVKNIPFMKTDKAIYLSHQDNTKTLIDLPYGNKQFSMTIIMPGEGKKVDDLMSELSITQLNAWLAEVQETSLELHLPKFTLEYEKELSAVLSDMGMAEAFSNTADFSRMIEGIHDRIRIDEVKHKTFVEVNEEGTEAAGATSVGMVLTSLPPAIRVNKPFIFLIREKSSNTILFIGKLMEP